MGTTLLAGACALLLFTTEARGRVGWERHGERDGVVVDVADVLGSDVPVVRACAVIAAPTGAVWEFISGPGMRFEGLKVKRPTGSCGERCQYVYFRMGNWLITDRHYVIRMEWSADRREGGTTYEGAWSFPLERQPTNGDAVGIRGIGGSWRLEPLDGGRGTLAIYTNHLDLGGSVPPGLYSLGFIRHAYDVLAKVRIGAEGPGR